MRSKRSTMKVTAALAVAALVVACGGGDDESSGGGGDADSITVWVVEDIADRVAKIEASAEQFSQESGIDVEIVPVAEAQFDQLMTSAAAAGDLPDVVGALPIAGVQSMAVNGLVDTDAAGELVEELGTDTFAEAALDLTQDGDDQQLAVPSESFPILLTYRRDLFDAAGLEPPTTYDAIRTAAETLDSPQVAGITTMTVPNDPFTQQAFELFAVANDCEMVDDDGNLTLDSPNCVEAFDLYGDLTRDYSVPGNQDVESTRATYFAGQAAMIVWSSFLLDEMAGLRQDALPTCPQCRQNPAYLAENSGVVSAIQGPDADEPSSLGDALGWVITADAATEAASDYVDFMMNDAYVDWLAIAPEGKIPARRGTEDDPEQFINAWDGLESGVDRKAPLADFYDEETLEAMRTSADTMRRWGFEQGQGALIGATLGELPVPAAISELAAGSIDAEQAAAQANDEVAEIQQGLE